METPPENPVIKAKLRVNILLSAFAMILFASEPQFQFFAIPIALFGGFCHTILSRMNRRKRLDEQD